MGNPARFIAAVPSRRLIFNKKYKLDEKVNQKKCATRKRVCESFNSHRTILAHDSLVFSSMQNKNCKYCMAWCCCSLIFISVIKYLHWICSECDYEKFIEKYFYSLEIFRKLSQSFSFLRNFNLGILSKSKFSSRKNILKTCCNFDDVS